MIAQSHRTAQRQVHFTFYRPVPIICSNNTHQGYVYKHTLKQVGYFLYDTLAMPMIKCKLLVKHTLASLLSICFILSVYKFYLNHFIKTFQITLSVNFTVNNVIEFLNTFLTSIIIKYFCKHFFTLLRIDLRIPFNIPAMPMIEFAQLRTNWRVFNVWSTRHA